MGTEDSLSVSFYNYLDEIVLNVQRLSLGCIFILVKADEHFVRSILRYGFLFFHSDACNLRVGEYGVRHSVVVYFDLPFEYRVVVDYSRLVVCDMLDRKSTRLNSSHTVISYAVFCLKKKNNK